MTMRFLWKKHYKLSLAFLFFIHLNFLQGATEAISDEESTNSSTTTSDLVSTSSPRSSALVYKTRNLTAVNSNYVVRNEQVRTMIDKLIAAVTQSASATEGWKKLIKPTDIVGIKVAAISGVASPARRAVILSIIESLLTSGHPSNRILVWDRDQTEMRLSQLLAPSSEQPKVPLLPCLSSAIAPKIGYDPKAIFTSPILGKLIWGDLQFQGQNSLGGLDDEDDLSNESPFVRLSQKVTKIINVPVLSDSAYAGVAGALYNMTIPNIDNWRRLVQEPRFGNPFIAEIYSDPLIRQKVVLQILDGLVAQYAGGPTFQPLYSFPHATIYASKDPVAIDTIAFHLIESWREQGKLPSVSKQTEYIKTASEIGLGTTSVSMVNCGVN